MRVKLMDVSDVEDVMSVPEGVYDVRVAEVRPGRTRDGSERWALRLDVTDGEYAGRFAAWDGLVWSERGKPRAKRVLSILGFPVDEEFDLEPGDLEGRRGRVRLQLEEREDQGGILRRGMSVPYDGWGVYGGAGEETPREALARDSPF